MKFLGNMAIVLLSLALAGCEPDRAKLAKEEKWDGLKLALGQIGIDPEGGFDLFFRAFKQEKTLEVWAKNRSDTIFVLLKSYPVCAASGTLGPKRRQGDKQVPEGIYHINRFNPKSRYYLSLGLNYPNEADQLLGEPGQLGSDIFIHGDCASIGCLAMTDDFAKEIYVLAEAARYSGQNHSPVHIFPERMTEENLAKMIAAQPEHSSLWEELKPVFLYFEAKKQLPVVKISAEGGYYL